MEYGIFPKNAKAQEPISPLMLIGDDVRYIFEITPWILGEHDSEQLETRQHDKDLPQYFRISKRKVKKNFYIRLPTTILTRRPMNWKE